MPVHNSCLCYQQINMNHRAHLTVFCWDLNTIYIIHQAHDIVLNLVLNGLRKDHCCVPFHSWLIWHQTSCVPAISTCHKVCPVEPTLNCSSSVVTEGSALKNNSLQSCVTHYKKMALILHEKQHFVFLFFQPCADWISLSNFSFLVCRHLFLLSQVAASLNIQ